MNWRVGVTGSSFLQEVNTIAAAKRAATPKDN
jgi:hypothetical protein